MSFLPKKKKGWISKVYKGKQFCSYYLDSLRASVKDAGKAVASIVESKRHAVCVHC